MALSILLFDTGAALKVAAMLRFSLSEFADASRLGLRRNLS
jgi:hypothetical protein